MKLWVRDIRSMFTRSAAHTSTRTKRRPVDQMSPCLEYPGRFCTPLTPFRERILDPSHFKALPEDQPNQLAVISRDVVRQFTSYWRRSLPQELVGGMKSHPGYSPTSCHPGPISYIILQRSPNTLHPAIQCSRVSLPLALKIRQLRYQIHKLDFRRAPDGILCIRRG